MTHNTTCIEQINLGYNQQEDRLLLKVGMVDKSEISLWITRRICKSLWNLLQNSHGQIGQVGQIMGQARGVETSQAFSTEVALSAPPLVSTTMPEPSQKDQAIAKFERDIVQRKSLEVMDFSTEYAANRKALSESPILVVHCAIGLTETQATNLIFEAQQGESIKMGLTLELVVALSNMMQLATREAGWDLLMLQNNVALNLTSTEHVLH
jgi:hypothetical protein